ncbi:reverse transcriptase family protein [Arcobacter sp. YIC-80]|uniref:reverse transcriptase family protein n=1 Tax=Arcobacter sp. YIC-80 TaxID=3376683 RepID=UPI00384C51BA
MINLQYELSTLGITSKFQNISNIQYSEKCINENYFYKVIDKDLEKVQKKLASSLANKIETNLSSFAYRKGVSYFDFLLPHKDNYNFLRLDIKSFFHSIKEKYIRKTFENYLKNVDNNSFLKMEDDSLAIDSFLNMITLKLPTVCSNTKYHNKTILPIGFVTSPVISNIVFRPIDIQIQKLCEKYKITYSRYADDMLFSSIKNESHIFTNDFIKDIKKILSQFDFKLNLNKKIEMKHTLSLNGYTISNSEIRISNKKIIVIKKMIHFYNSKMKSKEILRRLYNYSLPQRCNSLSTIEKNKLYTDQLLNKLTGYRSFLISIIKFNNKHKSFNEKTLTKKKYQRLIYEIENIIENINN